MTNTIKLGNGDICRPDCRDGATFPGTINDQPSMTRQSEKDSTDINLIMKTYDRTGAFPWPTEQPLFMDVTKVPSYREALDRVHEAEEIFMSLDPKTRARFNNDPAQFLDYTSNPANAGEMLALGWIEEQTALDMGYKKPEEKPPAPPTTTP